MRWWVVLIDPSLRAVAEKPAQWRKDGLLNAEDHGFNFSPHEANYFAHLCPAEKGILDARLLASPAAAADYVTVRRTLLGAGAHRERDREKDWRSILRVHHINHVVTYGNNPERVDAVFRRLIGNEAEWKLISLTGHTATFSWNDPQRQVHTLDFALPLEQSDSAGGSDGRLWAIRCGFG